MDFIFNKNLYTFALNAGLFFMAIYNDDRL